jgi:hypothetical protein
VAKLISIIGYPNRYTTELLSDLEGLQTIFSTLLNPLMMDSIHGCMVKGQKERFKMHIMAALNNG